MPFSLNFRVRILHGTGTGALRQIIREYLGTVDGVTHFQDDVELEELEHCCGFG